MSKISGTKVYMLRTLLKKLCNHLSAMLAYALLCTTVPLMASGFFWSSNSVILTGLDEQEANEIVVILDEHGINSEKKLVAASGSNKVPTWNLAVQNEKKMEALALLNMRGVPRRRRTNILLNLFSKQGLVSSDMEDKVRYQAGLADQIASTLRKLEGILDADVQLSIPQEDNIPGSNTAEIPKVTAAIYIKHRGILDDPNAHMYLKIKRLVASSIPGLDIENVTVIGDRAAIGTPGYGMPSIEFVSIWGVHVAEESAFFLKIILGILSGLISLFLCLSIWLLVKMSSIILKQGIRSLISPIPYTSSDEDSSQENNLEKQDSTSEEEKNSNASGDQPANLESTSPEGGPIAPSSASGGMRGNAPRMPTGTTPRR